MKFENNWRQKTLENLEKSYWGEPTYDSYLVTTCHALRKKPLSEFTAEDLRIMIGQNISLPYLIPLAIEVLQTDILAEGRLGPADLFWNVLDIDTEFWDNNSKYLQAIIDIINGHPGEIEEYRLYRTEFFKKGYSTVSS